MKNEKKIGVRFGDYRGSIYCYVTYDRRNTKFKYSEEEIDVKKEEEIVRLIISYLVKRDQEFTLKKISGRVGMLRYYPTTGNHSFAMYFGHIFSYYQYNYLKTIIDGRPDDNYESLKQFLNIKSIGSKMMETLRFKDKNYLLDLDKEELHFLITYMYLNHFKVYSDTRVIHWIMKREESKELFSNFVLSNTDVYKLTGIDMIKGMMISKEEKCDSKLFITVAQMLEVVDKEVRSCMEIVDQP